MGCWGVLGYEMFLCVTCDEEVKNYVLILNIISVKVSRYRQLSQ